MEHLIQVNINFNGDYVTSNKPSVNKQMVKQNPTTKLVPIKRSIRNQVPLVQPGKTSRVFSTLEPAAMPIRNKAYYDLPFDGNEINSKEINNETSNESLTANDIYLRDKVKILEKNMSNITSALNNINYEIQCLHVSNDYIKAHRSESSSNLPVKEPKLNEAVSLASLPVIKTENTLQPAYIDLTIDNFGDEVIEYISVMDNIPENNIPENNITENSVVEESVIDNVIEENSVTKDNEAENNIEENVQHNTSSDLISNEKSNEDVWYSVSGQSCLVDKEVLANADEFIENRLKENAEEDKTDKTDIHHKIDNLDDSAYLTCIEPISYSDWARVQMIDPQVLVNHAEFINDHIKQDITDSTLELINNT